MIGPHQLCYVNCGLPADECSCYRDIMSRAGDPAVIAALPEVQALIAAAYEAAERNLRAYCVSQVVKETLTEQLCSAIGTPAKAAAQADYDARILAAIQPDPEARQEALAKAWTMATAAMAERAKSELSAAWAADLIVQWAQSMPPPADLAAKIGGE